VYGYGHDGEPLRWSSLAFDGERELATKGESDSRRGGLPGRRLAISDGVCLATRGLAQEKCLMQGRRGEQVVPMDVEDGEGEAAYDAGGAAEDRG